MIKGSCGPRFIRVDASGHNPPDLDPHVWLGVKGAVALIDTVRAALTELAPERADDPLEAPLTVGEPVVDGLDPEMARRGFGATSNPRLDAPEQRAVVAERTAGDVVPFPRSKGRML